ncbi:MAG: hypothetical protein C0433_20535 [Cyclobacterium sp.]|nr:hypothetical protein [Cyclobacterium sp.]
MLSISLAFKLPILRTKSTHESVEVMLQGYKQLTRDKLEDQRFYPRPFPSKLKRDPLLAQKLHILEGFPGIGVDKAERLLTKFGSLQAIFSASSDVLLETPGIGKKTAEGMLEILKK